MRALRGPGEDLDVLEVVVAALPVQALPGPGRQHDLHGLVEALGALRRGHAEGAELTGVEAAASPPVHPSSGEHVEQRDLLGDAQRVLHGSERHRRSDSQALGARCEVAAHHVDRGTHAVAAEVVFGEPDRVVVRLVHDADAFQGPGVDILERDLPVPPAEELQHTHPHGVDSPRSRSLGRVAVVQPALLVDRSRCCRASP